MKTLYLYSGARKDKFRGEIGKDYPDTQFYGLNHLGRFGVDAEYKELGSGTGVTPLGFRLRHFFMYFSAKKYDIVFGSSILYMMLWKKIIPTKTKFILFNISLTRTLKANRNRFFKYRIILWLLKSVDAVVCLSDSQKKYLEKETSFLKDKIFFVPLGVDENYYKAENKKRKNYILSVGRDNGRDYKTVIETARVMPDEEFHIVCSKRNLLGIDNIPNNVKVFLDLSVSELRTKYQEAKLLLLVSHGDNHCDGSDCSGQTVLLDAMASGLPVIATKKEYLSDYVEEGGNVLLVEPYDVEGIKNKIKELNDPLVNNRIAEETRKKVEFYFSTAKMAERLSKVFKKVYEFHEK